MKENEKYLTFALPMVRDVILNKPDAISNIIEYSVYRASLNIQTDRRAAYKQLLYMEARHPQQVPQDFTDEIQDFFGCDAADLMADSGEIIDDYLDEFANACECYDDVAEWYRVYLAKDVVGVKLGSIPDTIETGRKFYEMYGDGQIPVSISTLSLFVFRDKMKTEYDRVKFAMYVAIRSLAGNSVAVTTSTAIKWRMFGARNADELKSVLLCKKMKSLYEKWTTKYYYRMMLNDLIDANLIREINYHRNTCVTASILDETKFIEAVATKIRRISQAAKWQKVRQQKKQLQNMLQRELNTS